MKFKEQRGNVFVFDDDGRELVLTIKTISNEFISKQVLKFKKVIISKEDRSFSCLNCNYKDIQTAVKLMQILIDEGLV